MTSIFKDDDVTQLNIFDFEGTVLLFSPDDEYVTCHAKIILVARNKIGYFSHCVTCNEKL